MFRPRRILRLLLAVAFGAAAVSARASSDAHSEYQVKAAFLFNFAKFVTWPPAAFSDPHAPIVIGILGDDPFKGDLAQIIAGQRITAARSTSSTAAAPPTLPAAI